MREDIELESCDLGNQSVLHAVKVLRKPPAHLDIEVRIQIGGPTTCKNMLYNMQAGILEDEEDILPGPDQGAAPLASTLVDLQLEGEARKAREAQRAHFFCWCSLKVNSSYKVSF